MTKMQPQEGLPRCSVSSALYSFPTVPAPAPAPHTAMGGSHIYVRYLSS